MSYDIDLEIGTGGDESVTVYTWNYTSNCAPMWRAAGADLAEFDGRPASACAPILAAALTELRAHPATYQELNPPNGWGSYDSLVEALDQLRVAMNTHPATTVRVCR